MKLRNLLAVLVALGIVGGIYAFARTRPDESRGAVTIWYVEGVKAADALKALAEDYNSSVARAELPVKLVGFDSEQTMAAAFDEGAPDLVFCSHYRALDMYERAKLTDVSLALSDGAPEYAKTLTSRSACIGKSFFPVGLNAQVLLINTELCVGADMSSLEALSLSAQDYTVATGKPFYSVGSFSALFFTALLREGEEFSAMLTDKPTPTYTTLYNLFAENAYVGALTVAADGAAEKVSSGELPCAAVMTSELPAKLPRALEVRAVPPLRSDSGSGALNEAWGLAVTAMGSRSVNDISAFLSWLFSGNRDVHIALQCSLIPVQKTSLVTRDALWNTLLSLDTGEIIALPMPDSDYYLNRADFDEEFTRRMAFLME